MYGGRQLRRGVRQRGMGYVMAVRANHALTTGPGRTMTAAKAARVIPAPAWQRMRTGSGTKGIRHYDWAMLEVTTVPELLRLLRDIVIPPPRRDRAHRLHWSAWRRRHQHRARQAHQRWNAYAEAKP